MKSKVLNLVKELRNGSSVLHYERNLEDELNNPENFSLLPTSYLTLTSKEKYFKSIIKKCLKPNRIYKITDHKLLELIDKMVSFNKRDTVKVISYNLFILALVVSENPIRKIAHTGLLNIFSGFISPSLVTNFPIFAFILTAAGLAFEVGASANLSTIGLKFLFMLLKTGRVFRFAELMRSQLLIDHTDYVKELTQIDRENLPEIEPLIKSNNSKISYTREKPMKQERFVTTTPNSDIYYQKDFEINMLDGKFKETQKLNSTKDLEWCRNRKEVNLKPKYIPLKARIKTIADLKDLDTIAVRESTNKIIKTIQREQITSNLLDDCLE